MSRIKWNACLRNMVQRNVAVRKMGRIMRNTQLRRPTAGSPRQRNVGKKPRGAISVAPRGKLWYIIFREWGCLFKWRPHMCGSANYCKNSFLNRSTQMKSNQPNAIPEGMVTSMQTINLISPPFLRKVDHLTTISTIQFTTGMSRSISCTILLCLLNQVIFSSL